MKSTNGTQTPEPQSVFESTGHRRFYRLLGWLATLFTASLTEGVAQEVGWWQFRGPNGTGVSTSAKIPPIDFLAPGITSWRTELPGKGASSPIVVGDRIFVTCYSGYGLDRETPGAVGDLQRHILCLRRGDGQKIWQHDFKSSQPEDVFAGVGITEHGYASSTPVSDGRRLFAFLGKAGVAAFDLDGNLLWKKDIGNKSGEFAWGSASSPVLIGGVLVINASDESEALIGMNPTDGTERWRYSGIRNSWATPVAVTIGQHKAVILSVPRQILAFESLTGRLLWQTNNGAADTNVSESPVLDGRRILYMGGRSRTAVLINHDDAEGDVTQSHTVWEGTTSSRITTPVIHNGYVYYFSQNRAYCQELDTGAYIFEERLPRPSDPGRGRGLSLASYASPIIAGDNIFFVTRSGYCYVTRATPDFDVLHINTLSEAEPEFNATPAIHEDGIYIRSNRYLYGFSLSPNDAPAN